MGKDGLVNDRAYERDAMALGEDALDCLAVGGAGGGEGGVVEGALEVLVGG